MIKKNWAKFLGFAIGIGGAIVLNVTGVLSTSFIPAPDSIWGKNMIVLIATAICFGILIVMGWFMARKLDRKKLY